MRWASWSTATPARHGHTTRVSRVHNHMNKQLQLLTAYNHAAATPVRHGHTTRVSLLTIYACPQHLSLEQLCV